MTAFCKAVQDEQVAGPLRRDFDYKAWNAAHERLSESEADVSLCNAGLLIHDKANSIRTRLRVTFSNKLSATTKLRAFVAIANQNLCVLQDRTRKEFDKVIADAKPVVMPEFRSVKLTLPGGDEYSPDEIVQSIVDATEIVIKVILESKPNLSGNPHFSDVGWDEILLDFNLGSLYAHLEDIWDDCLWNDYRLDQTKDGKVFAPVDPTWQRRLAASRFRQDNLLMQFFDMAHAAHADMSNAGLRAFLGVRDIRALVKDGRKQVIQLTRHSGSREESMHLLAARLYASEPYYKELLHEPRQQLGDSSMSDLLSAWAVVSRAAQVQMEQLGNLSFPEDATPNTWAPKFAPVLQIRALARAIVRATNLNFRQAETIVQFLIYRGEKGQELWAQPLVPVNPQTVAPMLGAAISPNLRRLVDIWMRQLGVDLGLRGAAFESHVRTELMEYIARSQLRKDTTVLENSVTFRPQKDRDEQLDVVMVIRDLVIVGEAKCTLHPAEAKQEAMHRRTVTDAVAQVKRKALSIEVHSAAFRERLRQLGVEIPVNFNVLPVVILNGAVHAGFEVDQVPVVDMFIFGVFFSGELVDVAVRHGKGDMEHVKKRILYTDVQEAVRNAPAYLRAPPQMEILWEGMQERWVSIPSISETDWGGQYLTYDCVPRMQQVRDVVNTASASSHSG